MSRKTNATKTLCDQIHICPICHKEFHSSKRSPICCNKICNQIYKFGAMPYTKEEVLNLIINKATELGRTPQKRECESKLFNTAARLFGTWNKAMKECGLKPNPSKYQKIRLKCVDGHMADSISEMIVDNWLYSQSLKHERLKKYSPTNMDCDFYLVDYDIWVEYFGLINENEEYDQTVKKKRLFAEQNGLNLIGITHDYLYPYVRLNELFKNILPKVPI